jgi:hypothetical protein
LSLVSTAPLFSKTCFSVVENALFSKGYLITKKKQR